MLGELDRISDKHVSWSGKSIAFAEPEARSLLLLQLMALPNQEWKQAHALIMQTSIENLELRLVRRVTEILQINERVAE